MLGVLSTREIGGEGFFTFKHIGMLGKHLQNS